MNRDPGEHVVSSWQSQASTYRVIHQVRTDHLTFHGKLHYTFPLTKSDLMNNLLKTFHGIWVLVVGVGILEVNVAKAHCGYKGKCSANVRCSVNFGTAWGGMYKSQKINFDTF